MPIAYGQSSSPVRTVFTRDVLYNMKKTDSQLKKTIETLNAFLTNNFDNYIELQSFIEKHIQINQKQYDEKYNKLEEIEDDNEWKIAHDRFDEELGTDMYRFDHEFPNRTRFFMIVQTHSMLEVYLKWFCEKLQMINHNPISISDLKGGSDLEKGKLYLKRIYGLDFSKLEPEWSFLNNMRKIRNQIIHNNGIFKTSDKEIIRIIENTDELGRMWEDIEPEFVENKEYEIKISSKNLNEKYMVSVKTFFQKVIVGIQDKAENTAYNN